MTVCQTVCQTPKFGAESKKSWHPCSMLPEVFSGPAEVFESLKKNRLPLLNFRDISAEVFRQQIFATRSF